MIDCWNYIMERYRDSWLIASWWDVNFVYNKKKKILVSQYGNVLLLLCLWVVSNSLQLLELQHTRLLCLPLPPRVCSNSCPLSWWCYLTISSSAVLFSFCLQSFPEVGSFPMSWLFALTGQSIRASTLASVLPMNSQGWFPLGLTDLISLHPKQLSNLL